MEKQQQIQCFTDCSYSKQKGCVVGYKIGLNPTIIEQLKYGIKNTEGQLYAVAKCVQIAKQSYPQKLIVIYTDCLRAFKNSYGQGVILKKLQGHKPSRLKDQKDKLFSEVDKAVRKRLRQLPYKSSISNGNMKNQMQ